MNAAATSPAAKAGQFQISRMATNSRMLVISIVAETAMP
jgi:hypothetical protein